MEEDVADRLAWDAGASAKDALADAGASAKEALAPGSVDFYDKLFHEVPVGLALSRMDGSYVAVNKAFADIVGRTPDEILKLSYWQITPQRYAAQENKQLKILKVQRSYGPYYKHFIHKDGTLVPVRLEGQLIEYEGNQYTLSRVANLYNERFRALFQDADLGLALCDLSSGSFIDVNRRFADLVGRSEAELRGMTYDNLTPVQYQLDEAQQIQQLRTTGGFGPYSKEFIGKDGALIPVVVRGLKLPIGGVDYIWTIVQECVPEGADGGGEQESDGGPPTVEGRTGPIRCTLLSYDGERAHCLANSSGAVLPVKFPAEVLRDHGLEAGDVFLWSPRRGNAVSHEDIRRDSIEDPHLTEDEAARLEALIEEDEKLPAEALREYFGQGRP